MSLLREYTRSEELANAISHLAGAGLAAAGLVMMIVFSAMRGNAWHIVSTSIFGSTMLVMFLSSGMAHALKEGKAKDLFFTIDRISIFLLIAGTYTPITLIVIKGTLGWVIFGLEWGLATLGIILTFIKPGQSERRLNYLFIGLYAMMGWLFLVVIIPVFKSFSMMGILWILIGVLCYTAGMFFYSMAKFRFYHLVWHLLVIGGCLSHFFAIFYHVIP
jgi:hemolysin III